MPRSVVFENIRNSYNAFSYRVPWFYVITPEEFKILQKTSWYQDEQNFAILWALVPPGPKEDRHAKVALVYSEAFGKEEDLLPEHWRQWGYFRGIAQEYDLLLGHTPSTAAAMSDLGVPTDVLPAGWDPEGLDFPKEEKGGHLVFYGSTVGKRTWSVPRLRERLGNVLREVTGSFGKRVLREISASRAELYLAHSNCDSGSTWRIWHTIAAKSAFLTEPGDYWPLVQGRHYIEISRLTEENVCGVSDVIRDILGSDALENAQRDAWDEVANEYTTQKCVERNLIPASMKA
jgi:hypothetical protein